MKQQIRAALTKVKSLQHAVLHFPRCFEAFKNKIGELLDDLTESEAGEFYDLLDGIVIALEELDLHDLKKARELLKDGVESEVEKYKRLLRERGLAATAEDIPEEIVISAYLDRDENERELKGKRKQPLSSRQNRNRTLTQAQRDWSSGLKEGT